MRLRWGFPWTRLLSQFVKAYLLGRLKKSILLLPAFGLTIMPLLGYLLGTGFQSFIEQIDHWIAFVLLDMIGLGMIKESREQSKPLDASFSAKVMFPLAIADSIDALAAGVTFAFLEVNIIPAIVLIGIITFACSAFGLWLGNRFGEKYRAKAELVGGIILIIMGVKILLEHLGILG